MREIGLRTKQTAVCLALAVVLSMAAGESLAAQALLSSKEYAAVCTPKPLEMTVAMPTAKPEIDGVAVRFTSETTSDTICVMKLTIFAQCEELNSVGNEWSFGFELNGEPVTDGSPGIVCADAGVVLYAWAIEDEKHPDTGDEENTVVISPENLQSGFTFT